MGGDHYRTLRRWANRHKRRLIAAFVLAALAAAFWLSLPKPLFQPPYSTVLLARDGQLLGAKIADDGQWRFPPTDQVPTKFSTALIAFEDKRFAHHPGIDPLALARATRLNLERKRIVSGGSTLTMQVARLARGTQQRGYVEKIAEILLAVRIELSYSKDEILALYAENAPFGGNVVGLEAASWRYFGRPPTQISWAEACTLAVLPNSPSLIHPGRNRSWLQTKRDRLLRELRDAQTITDIDFDLAVREPLPVEPLPLPQLAPHLLESLHGQYPDVHRLQSTLDARLQTTATQIVQERAQQLKRQDIHNAAALIADNKTFEILAYVGNNEWSVSGDRAHAVDIIRRPRSTGSILKPFLFAAMLDAGEILPSTLISDVPTQFGGYMPENFDHGYRGAVPAQVALAQSLNVPAVRMLKQHGIQRFYDYLTQLGMTTLNRPADGYGLTLILGGAEANLRDVAGMYANLAAIARREASEARKPYQSLRILSNATPASSTGKPAELSAGAAWLTLRALMEVARPNDEAHWKNFASSRQISWKTGTSWGQRDAWAVGTTTRHTVAVWAGNASGEGRAGLTGASTAAPLMFDLFNRLESAPWFSMPTSQLKEVEICTNDGYLSNGSCATTHDWAPKDSHFDQPSPHNLRIHLDASRQHRVDSRCERVANLVSENWFVLPPGSEFYYRRQHAEYKTLPSFRTDCMTSGTARSPIDFLYPPPGTRIYIPIDLAETKSRVVFEAAHRDANATLHWHLDDVYIGTTQTFHQRGLDVPVGAHRITVVDSQGLTQTRRFEILSGNAP